MHWLQVHEINVGKMNLVGITTWPHPLTDDIDLSAITLICQYHNSNDTASNTHASHSTFLCEKKYGRLLKRVFFSWRYYNEIHGKNEWSKRRQHMLFGALPRDWETTMHPAPAPLIPAIGEPHPSFVHATLHDLENQTLRRTKHIAFMHTHVCTKCNHLFIINLFSEPSMQLILTYNLTLKL